MEEIAAEIILDDEIALVDRGYERQRIHALERRPVLVVHDRAVSAAPAQARDPREFAPFGHFLYGEIEFVARYEIDGRRGAQACLRLDRYLGADHADRDLRIDRLESLGGLEVGCKRWRRRMKHNQLAPPGLGRDVLEFEPVRRRVDELRAFHER